MKSQLKAFLGHKPRAMTVTVLRQKPSKITSQLVNGSHGKVLAIMVNKYKVVKMR